MLEHKKQIDIAIIDDHKLFRQGLGQLIEMVNKEQRYQVVFQAGNGIELIKELERSAAPDIVLMDIDMPEMDGFQSVEWLKTNYPEVKILVISMIENRKSITKMMKLGANGYLSKEIEIEDMEEALNAIIKKGYYFTPEIIEALNDSILLPELSLLLTDRELQFLQFCSSELTYREIAEKMFVSPRTVD